MSFRCIERPVSFAALALFTTLLFTRFHKTEANNELASGISGMIDTAKSIHSVTSQMTSLLSALMNKATGEAAVSASGKREGENRYRHNYYINPVMHSNVTTRKRHIPKIWDMASNSYRVEFMIYSRNNPAMEEILSVENATQSKLFDKMKETKLIIHDYNQSYNDPLLIQLRNAYLHKNYDYNIIIVDWVQARKYSYTVAARVTEYVGVMSARLLMELDADFSTVHAIGFGLGAHACGVLGADLNGKLRRITGLDPSLPLFRMADDHQKLDSADAIFVDVIHTDGGDNLWHATHLGMGNAMGHVDVYVNSGIYQPGCPTPTLPSYDDMYCSHVRSLELFLESILNRQNLIACSCGSWEEFKTLQCDCTKKMIYVGDSCPKRARGKFYMVTRNHIPYGMGRNGAYPLPQFKIM